MRAFSAILIIVILIILSGCGPKAVAVQMDYDEDGVLMDADTTSVYVEAMGNRFRAVSVREMTQSPSVIIVAGVIDNRVIRVRAADGDSSFYVLDRHERVELTSGSLWDSSVYALADAEQLSDEARDQAMLVVVR